MSDIIKESWVEENTYFTLDYNLKEDPGCGYTFPCDEDGKLEELNPATKESYKYVQENLSIYYGPMVRKHVDRFRHYATIQCDCDEQFELHDEFLGTCGCPKCGQYYNLFGQKTLAPYEYDYEDDDYAEYPSYF